MPGALVLLLGVAAVPAGAQGRAPSHRGLYLALGPAWGSSQIRSNSRGSARESGLAGNLRLGAALTRQFTLCLELEGWTRGEDPSGHSSLAGVDAAALVYPLRTRPAFFKVGIGYANFTVAGTSRDTSADGTGGAAGLGYDVPVGAGLCLTPGAEIALGGFDGFSSNTIAATLTLTRH